MGDCPTGGKMKITAKRMATYTLQIGEAAELCNCKRAELGRGLVEYAGQFELTKGKPQEGWIVTMETVPGFLSTFFDNSTVDDCTVISTSANLHDLLNYQKPESIESAFEILDNVRTSSFHWGDEPVAGGAEFMSTVLRLQQQVGELTREETTAPTQTGAEKRGKNA
jgi:hypothetical protein